MIIGLSGYGYSGASAYLDALKEFEGVQTLPFEFQLVQEPDGLLDLMYGIVETKRRSYSNTAINRFIKCVYSNANSNLSRCLNGKFEIISERYVNDLVDLTWRGKSNYDPEDVRHPIDRKKYALINKAIHGIFKVLKINREWPPFRQRFFSELDELSFVKKTQGYINEILIEAGIDFKEPIVLDQVFSTSAPKSGVQFFDHNVVSLIVDRDPRDVFILTNFLYPAKSGFMPNDGDVEKFITYYSCLHNNYTDDESVCYLSFENLIYQYSQTIEYLSTLLEKRHINPRKFFQPEKSINNTQLFKRYKEHYKDICIIEKRLDKYLYNFDNAEKFLKIEREEMQPF